MTDLERLLAIAEIKQLKATYFLALDHQQWERFPVEIFTPDVTFQLSEFREEPWCGADDVLDMFSTNLVDRKSVHHGHMPIIELTSDTTATGIWAMEDRIYLAAPGSVLEQQPILHGWGHYHEVYVKTGAGWRIKDIRLTRLRLEGLAAS